MSSAFNETFSPQKLRVLGGLLLVAIILGEVVFNSKGSVDVRVDPMDAMKGIAMRLKPVVTLDDIQNGTSSAATSTGATDTASTSDGVDKTPEQLYQGACFACHGTGAAGAPKLGDTAAWAGRIGKGVDALLSSAINGIGAMPPKGGAQYNEDQMRAVVEYMVDGSN